MNDNLNNSHFDTNNFSIIKNRKSRLESHKNISYDTKNKNTTNGSNREANENSHFHTISSSIPLCSSTANSQNITITKSKVRRKMKLSYCPTIKDLKNIKTNKNNNNYSLQNFLLLPRISSFTLLIILSLIKSIRIVNAQINNNLVSSNVNSNFNNNRLRQYSSCPNLDSPQVITDDNSELSSSNYGIDNYDTGSNCSWIIQAPANKRIKLLILDARLETNLIENVDNSEDDQELESWGIRRR